MVLCLIMVGNGVRSVSAQGQTPQPRQIWTHSGGGGWTISPDGRYIAFPAYDGVTQNLGLHDLVTGSDIRLTHNNNPREYPSKPVFSPDGKQIAFTWYQPPAAAEVRVMGIDGGIPGASRLLFKQDEVNFTFLADWSPDGKWIAAKFYRTDRTAQLALISASDGLVRVLKTVDSAAPPQVYFSPDNRYLAHTRPSDRASKDTDIYLLAIDGGQEIPAVVHPANDGALGWSRDGQLLFVSNRNGSSSLWSQAIDSGRPQGNPQLLLPNFGATLPFYMGATRTGNLYYSALAGSTKIAVATVDWNSGKISTSEEFAQAIQPEWSPDGESLAFKGLRQDGGVYLVIRSLETGQSRELHPKMTSFNWPRWSPDGKSFLLQGTDDRARQGIFRMDAATGELRVVA
jgi:Tol biopolymer transport system component